MPKAAEALFEQLDKALKGPEGDEIQGKTKVLSALACVPRLSRALCLLHTALGLARASGSAAGTTARCSGIVKLAYRSVL